jgi:hypothetical protein
MIRLDRFHSDKATPSRKRVWIDEASCNTLISFSSLIRRTGRREIDNRPLATFGAKVHFHPVFQKVNIRPRVRIRISDPFGTKGTPESV